MNGLAFLGHNLGNLYTAYSQAAPLLAGVRHRPFPDGSGSVQTDEGTEPY
jgi:hypothetical protein